jgi:alpha-amylase
MVSICLYFQVHQPHRINKLRVFDIDGEEKDYFDKNLNQEILKKVAKNSYIPMNFLLKKIIDKYGDEFKCNFSLSGSVIEQFEDFSPETLISFLRLKDTNSVEFISETNYHSLSSVISEEKFINEINEHLEKTKDFRDEKPQIFRNTELLYNDDIDEALESLGYKAIIVDGSVVEKQGKSPNHIYGKKNSGIKLICKNCDISDDIAFRFARENNWEIHKKNILRKIEKLNCEGAEMINLFMDYETFGEHFHKDTGIFDFFQSLIEDLIEKGYQFNTLSELIDIYDIKDKINVKEFSSWADEKGIDAWQENEIQKEALRTYSNIVEKSQKINIDENDEISKILKKLGTSDHFYYMSTKQFNDGVIHDYFSVYNSPYDAYIYYMNILNDIDLRLNKMKTNLDLEKDSKTNFSLV